jgi:hypothetical protein
LPSIPERNSGTLLRKCQFRPQTCLLNVRAREIAGPREAVVNKTLGIVLIVLGLFGLAWGGFTYTTRETVVDIGPIHATRDKTHNIPLPPIAGAVALIGGVVLLAAGSKQ